MRTRQAPAETPVGRHSGVFPAHAQAVASGDLPAGRDEQIALIFRNMRLAMKVPRETIARRLATSTITIDNFEAGAIAALPHWKETARIVRAYCELLRLDPEPILWRVRSHLQPSASAGHGKAGAPAHAPQVAASETTTTAPGPPPGVLVEPRRTAANSRRLAVQGLVAVAVPIVLFAVVAGLAHVAPRPVYRAVTLLPDAIETPLRAGLDSLMLLTAPRHEGLRWIDVGDPQLRKADKLPTSTR